MSRTKINVNPAKTAAVPKIANPREAWASLPSSASPYSNSMHMADKDVWESAMWSQLPDWPWLWAQSYPLDISSSLSGRHTLKSEKKPIIATIQKGMAAAVTTADSNRKTKLVMGVLIFQAVQDSKLANSANPMKILWSSFTVSGLIKTPSTMIKITDTVPINPNAR